MQSPNTHAHELLTFKPKDLLWPFKDTRTLLLILTHVLNAIKLLVIFSKNAGFAFVESCDGFI